MDLYSPDAAAGAPTPEIGFSDGVSSEKVGRHIRTGRRFFKSGLSTISLYDLTKVGRIAVYPAGSYLFRQGTSADQIFEIKSGLVSTYHIRATGDRRIVDFYTAGRLIGIAIQGAYRLSCEAITCAEVAVFSRKAILAKASSNRAIVKKLWAELVSERLMHEQHIVWLGSSASERVGGFLLAMADHAENGLIELPMTRRELSEYLGLTIETVSRFMTVLREKGAISFLNDSNRIKILNRARLEKEVGFT